MLAGIEADTNKDAKKSKRKASGTPKKSAQKAKGTPKAKKAQAEKKKKEPKGKKGKAADKNKGKAPATSRAQPNLLNMGSLLGNDLYDTANANIGRTQLATPTATAKNEALAQLIASVPEEDKRGAQTDKTHVLKATKILSKYNVHYDGKGGWLLKGMILLALTRQGSLLYSGMVSSLRPYQVLGAAFMVRHI